MGKNPKKRPKTSRIFERGGGGEKTKVKNEKHSVQRVDNNKKRPNWPYLFEFEWWGSVRGEKKRRRKTHLFWPSFCACNGRVTFRVWMGEGGRK
jgi:hypothetical protein